MSTNRHKKVWLTLISVMTATLLAAPTHATTIEPTVAIDAGSETLQNAFDKASQEFGVPKSVLMSVSYNESRWEQHDGEPSVEGGYGVMHLTQLDGSSIETNAKGEEETNVLNPDDPALHTLDQAATLLGVDADTLKQDQEQNIRGGAALLAQYARDTVGSVPEDPAAWYGAVVKYSGSDEQEIAEGFADDVYATVQQGAERTTPSGQHAKFDGVQVTPDKGTTGKLNLHHENNSDTDCPNDIACRYLPALYQQFSSKNTDYGNYDLANRPNDGLDIRYIVIHDIEGTYEAGIKTFQTKSYVSAHYVVNNVNGEVTEMVRPENVAWQAGNWYMNAHSIGIEHGGIAVDGASWYSEPMYRSSAKLVKYLAHKYDIPLDREHILGHDDVPGLSQSAQTNMHWDPGTFWDWAHYFDLLGGNGNDDYHGDWGHDFDKSSFHNDHVVTINPDFKTNQPVLTYAGKTLPAQPSNFVYLYTAPSFAAPLLSDKATHANGAPGTTVIYDWGDKAVTGQTFYQADQQGDWTAIYYAGQKAWFYNPNNKNTVSSRGLLITPKAGLTSIPVYGAAYPEAQAFADAGIPKVTNNALQYNIPAGQVYVSAGTVPSDYFYAKIFNAPSTYKVVKGTDEYYQIRFNHRIAYVKTSDVDVVKDDLK